MHVHRSAGSLMRFSSSAASAESFSVVAISRRLSEAAAAAGESSAEVTTGPYSRAALRSRAHTILSVVTGSPALQRAKRGGRTWLSLWPQLQRYRAYNNDSFDT